MNNHTAIILAAGQGSRLRPLTDHIPKCMVKVGDKPILLRQLDTLQAAGIEDIVVVAGYKKEKISDNRITVVENERFDSTNMIYSLFCAEEYLNGNVLICYGDIIYSKSVLNQILQDERDIVIASDKSWLPYWQSRCDDPLSDAESFVKNTNGKVKSLGKKASDINEVEGQFIGLIKLSAAGLEQFKKVYKECLSSESCSVNAWNAGRDLNNAYMTDMLNHLASQGKLHYSEIERGWFEVDNPDDLKVAEDNLHEITQ